MSFLFEVCEKVSIPVAGCYTPGFDYANSGPQTISAEANVVDCQNNCQADDDCAYFMYRVR